MTSRNETPDALEILTNGRAFAAMVEDMVFLPNGRGVSADTAEEMGFEESEDATAADLTAAAREAAEGALSTLDAAADGRARFDAAAAAAAAAKAERIAARKAARAAYAASPEGKAAAARELALWRGIARAISEGDIEAAAKLARG